MYFVRSSMSGWRDYNRGVKTHPFRAVFFVLFLAWGAGAFDPVKESIPRRWIEPLVPEELPKLKFPAYFNDLDKARAQMQGGRYKLSLLTLAKAKDADPVEVVVIKAASLSATGRTAKALGALSDDKVKD